jgi:branched-chain amino acid transport system substrate-binding protein
MLPVLEQADGVTVTAGPSGMQVTHENFSRAMFRGHGQDYIESNMMAHLAADRFPDVQNWVSCIIDTQALRNGVKMFQKLLRDAHGANAAKLEFLDEIAVAPGATDMRAQISGIANSKAQGDLEVLVGQSEITFWQQASPFGLQKKLDVVLARSSEPKLWEAMKTNLPKTFWVSQYWWPDAYKSVPESVECFQEFRVRTKEDYPPSNFWFGATGIHTFAAAIRAASGATDAKTLITVLENGLKIPSLRGPVYYRKEDHQIICPMDVVKVEASDGRPGFKVTDFVSYDGAKLADAAGPGTPFKI